MIPGSGGFIGGYNQDVLNAEPTTEESKSKLIEEIKNRAKACISSRNYPEAVALYSKAITVGSDNSQQAILYANRSMCQLNMNKATDAINDANEAIQLDPNYLKGYYRLAMGHIQANSYAQAKDALQRGLALKGDDKELLQQLQKVEERLASSNSSSLSAPRSANKVSVSHSSTSKTVSSSTVPPPSSSSSTSAKSKPASSSSTSTPVAAEEDEEEDPELKSGNFRGYKKTADGRTTTFFNRDIDENTKALIGNIAPKKLDAKGEVILTGTTTGSAWNAAGTYEERNITTWVSDYLTSEFSKITVFIEENRLDAAIRQANAGVASVLIEATGVSNATGHAQVTIARGKTKHMCDFSFTLKWMLIVSYSDNSRAPNKVSGDLLVNDLTADREYEIEGIQVTHLNDNTAAQSALPAEVNQAFMKYVKNSSIGLQKEILQYLEKFWTELKTK